MTTFNLPDLGEGLAEAEIVAWHVKVGDRVRVDQPMVSVETAKAVVEVPSPYSGIIRALHGEAGTVVETGKPLVDFDIEGAVSVVKPVETVKPKPKVADDSGTVVGNMPMSDEVLVEHVVAGGSSVAVRDRVRAAPAARALARRLGVEIAGVSGSGRGGLITIDDVMSASQLQIARPQAGAGAARGAAIKAPVGDAERLRGTRRAMAHSMSLSRDQIASCTVFDDADLNDWTRKSSYTVRLLRAVAVGCKAEPGLNAWFDAESQSRKVIARVDIAIAVDTAEGLIVPVLRDVGSRSAAELRDEVARLKAAAQARSLTPEELKDFTIMLSNFGTIAGRYATPLVVPPAVAILGAGSLKHDVVAVMGRIEAHLRMPLSLTFDHRCVMGGEAVRFLAAVIKDLEQPD
jgi:2-oxoisovalerate dehydrogenase E2 component (dihydrolipoyl transacylase)